MLKSVSSTINAIGALNYKGTWNASTNTPTIVSSVGTKGDYYVVSVAGATNINGISNWGIGDWIVFNGAVWQRVEGGSDLNGVNVTFTGTASGPTYETSNLAAGLTITNNSITADGTDADINISLSPKGAGRVQIPGTSSNAAGIDLFEDADNGTNKALLTAPAALGADVTLTLPSTTATLGYQNLPAVGTQTGSYQLATTDVGKYVQVGAGGSITIPDAVFSEGDAVSIFNNTTGNITITCSITDAYIAGVDVDKATMTLATRGVATVLFISSTRCVVTGNVS